MTKSRFVRSIKYKLYDEGRMYDVKSDPFEACAVKCESTAKMDVRFLDVHKKS